MNLKIKKMRECFTHKIIQKSVLFVIFGNFISLFPLNIKIMTTENNVLWCANKSSSVKSDIFKVYVLISFGGVMTIV